MTNEEIINEIISFESTEYVNNPTDIGGPTKYGITSVTLGHYLKLGRPATIPEVVELQEDTAKKIYQIKYIEAPHFDLIKNDMLRWFMVDSGVVHGPINPINWLQQILNLKKDGVFGPLTNAAMEKYDPAYILLRLLGGRAEAIGRLVTRDPTQIKFLNGWMNRTNNICAKAGLVLSPSPQPNVTPISTPQKISFWSSLWKNLTK